MAVQAKRYESRGPNAYERYACGPPFCGIAEPSSAKLLAPVHAKSPAPNHTSKLAPTLCVFATTTPGEELRKLLELQVMHLVRKIRTIFLIRSVGVVSGDDKTNDHLLPAVPQSVQYLKLLVGLKKKNHTNIPFISPIFFSVLSACRVPGSVTLALSGNLNKKLRNKVDTQRAEHTKSR